MRISPGVTIVGGAVIVGVVEIALHWLLGRDVFPSFTAVYFHTDFPSGRQSFTGVLDNILPAVVLGWTVGWVGSLGWSWRKVAFVCIGTAIFIALLQPWYGYIIGWPRFTGAGNPEEAFRHWPYFQGTLMAYMLCLFFAKVAYDGRRARARSQSNGHNSSGPG